MDSCFHIKEKKKKNPSLIEIIKLIKSFIFLRSFKIAHFKASFE